MSKWFAKLHAEDFSLDDAPWSDRPVEVGSNQIETLIENSQCYTMLEIADTLSISESRIEHHLHQVGYVTHFDIWVLRKLNKKSLLGCFLACNSQLKHNADVPFLKQIGQAMKSEYCSIMWNRRNCGVS